MTIQHEPPLPPADLMRRVGHGGSPELEADYERVGRALKASILDSLPDGWTLDGKRVLDWGCGAGRVLRQFLPEAREDTEFWGSEIDIESVRWIQQNLSPPIQAVVHGESPPLPFPDGHFDLVYGMSVFTHITDEWAAWLLELHRLLAPDGLLLVSLLGRDLLGPILGEAADEDAIGHLTANPGVPWDEGGPLAFVSRWWIEAHWGRAFDVLWIRRGGLSGNNGRPGHDLALLRPRDVELSREQLEAPEPGEPRELEAARFNISLLTRQLAFFRRQMREAVAHHEHVAADARNQAVHWQSTAEQWERQADALATANAQLHATAQHLHRVAGETEQARAQLAEHVEALEAEHAEHVTVLEAEQAEQAERVAALEAELARARGTLVSLSTSHSWRLTAPLRAVAARLRG